jgi:nifR3 family TIM-barrel protein
MTSLLETLQNNPVFFAPMAGISDMPTRALMSRHGAGGTVSELVSVRGFLDNRPKSETLLESSIEEPCFGIQLVGADPGQMGEVAHIVSTEYPCQFIDINMGCPARKVLKSGGGADLLSDLPRASQIIKETVAASKLPVTVKTRIGVTEDSLEAIALGRLAQEAGAVALFLHGRSRTRGFKGDVNLDAIKKVKNALTIPVIGNGGIKFAEDAKKMMEVTGCDGVMVGTKILGSPWRFREIAATVAGSVCPTINPSIQDVAEIMLHHAKESQFYNNFRRLIPFRKQLIWYTKGWPESAQLREQLVRVTTLEDLQQIMVEYLSTYG